MELKTAIIVDMMGSDFGNKTPEMEVQELTESFSELLAPATLKVYQPYSAHPEAFEAGTDLILFDYGGMCLENSLMEDNSRYLLRFAQDNPNVLCVIVSGFTWRQAIARELEDSGLTGMHNVVPRWWEPVKLFSEETKPEDYDPIPEWFRLAHKLPRVDSYATAVVTKLKTPKRRK